jgi:hypothetical protein
LGARDLDDELPVPVPQAQGERVEGEVVAGSFVDGEWRAPYRSDAIIDPSSELTRLHNLAFNQSGRASGLPPAPKPGAYRHRSIRKG